MDLFEEYSNQELLTINPKYLGLKRCDWEFTRGARTIQKYLYENDAVAITDEYNYEMEDNNRSIKSYTRHLKWYDLEGNVKLQREISSIDQSVKHIKNVNRHIRHGRIDWMEESASLLAIYSPQVPEPYKTDFQKASNSLDLIFSYYDKEISHYLSRGTKEFEDAVNNETNPVILEILALKAYIPDSQFPLGLTIKESIIYQLTGVIPGV